MGIPLKAFDCKNELREISSDEVPELSPVSLVKIYLYFAANSFLRGRGTLTSCLETKREKKLSSVCKEKNYWKSHVQAHALFFAFYKSEMGLKYRDKQGE